MTDFATRETNHEYRCVEYDVGDETVTMITDSCNEYAWIQSSVGLPVRP